MVHRARPFASNPSAAPREAEVNPYASPRVADPAVLPILPRERWPEVQVQLLGVRKGVMQRWLIVGGFCEGEIHYNGWVTGEMVLVNKQVRGRGPWWYSTIVSPRIDFLIDAWDCRVPAWIDVKAGLALTLFRIKRFRLTIAGHVVYEEP